jgi:hypothetical protein
MATSNCIINKKKHIYKDKQEAKSVCAVSWIS